MESGSSEKVSEREVYRGRKCPVCGCDLGLNPFSICTVCGCVLPRED